MAEIQRRIRLGLAPAMLGAMVLALSFSATTLWAGDPPFCEGLECDEDSDCGSKCTCNENAEVCVDNTENQS